MIIPLVQPSKDIDDEFVVKDHIAQVTEGVSHVVHPTTVVAHREITLDEVVECGAKMKCMCLGVADQLVVERELDLACGGTTLLGDVLKLTDDRVVDPGDDDALHELPLRVVDRRGIRGNVAGKVVAPQG
jgi:hypothetical protein